MTYSYEFPNRDMSKAHPLLQSRWPILRDHLQLTFGWVFRVSEVYRPNLRQQWLYGAGRESDKLLAHGINPLFARPGERIVTNAYNNRTSAHGWMENGKPAAAGIDVVPLGPDGKPYTRDDPWDEFVRACAEFEGESGLRHFHSPGKAVWDKPHLQLVEWQDGPTFALVL